LTNWARNDLKIGNQHVHLLRNIIIAHGNIYSKNTRTKKMMMVANISRIKHIEFAISLSKKLGWQIDIYGNCRDVAYYNELKSLAAGSEDIRFISDHTDFTDTYSQYDLAIHCSKSESGPLVLLEYLAAGIPFISYQTGEVANVTYADLPTLFMDGFDYDDWAKRIIEIEQEKDLPAKMRAVFHKYFSSEKYTEECLAIYQKTGCS